MKKIWWIVGVIAVATAAFFVSGISGYIWAPILSAMAVVLVFFVGLTVYAFRKSRSTFDRVFAVGILSLLLAVTTYSAILNYRTSTWQLNLLMDIRATIEEGVSMAYSRQPLLALLQDYHEQNAQQHMTIGHLFESRYEKQIKTEDGRQRFIPKGLQGNSDESPFIFVKQTTSPDSVVLVAQSLLIAGQDSTFTNFNGQSGKMQFQAVLTEGGVRYEREN